ncbi:MAG: thioesterase family protein, partial [Thermosynechococcaceae cyanobacterium]
GHLNNVEYVQWMQVVAIAHAQHTTCAQSTAAVGATWIAKSHRIEYLRPAFEGEPLAILTWCAEIKRVRAQRQYRFFRLADQAVLAVGETEWVFADAQTGRPRAMPTAVANAFDVVTDEPSIETLLSNGNLSIAKPLISRLN